MKGFNYFTVFTIYMIKHVSLRFANLSEIENN